MKRVFFFTGFHMEVFDFDRKTLVGSLDFRDTDVGRARFDAFLSEASVVKSYLLVDLQDEDFRREQIPHVRGNDRKQLIDRLEKKIFRDVEFRHTLMLDRLKEGRKDDQVLFSTLMNVDDLSAWLGVFEKHETPLAGIWSVSYLGERILSKIGAKEENILLFSRQMRSAVRETVFKNGKLSISRQAKLERRVRSEHSAETTATIIASNIDVMHRFLINQRVLAFTESLNVYAIVPDEFVEKAAEYCEKSNTLKFNFIGIQQLFEKFGVKACEGKNADALFAYLCSQELAEKQQYLHGKRRQSYIKHQVNKLVKNVSVLGSFIFATVATFMLLNSSEYSKERVTVNQKIAQIQAQYESRFSDIQEQVDSANLVQESVLLADEIKKEAAVTPHALFPALGAVYGDSKYALFNINTLEWKKYPPQVYATLNAEYKDLSVVADREAESYDEYYSEDTDFRPVLVLKGELNREGLGYSRAVVLSESFVRAIESIESVEQVQVIVNPVDVRLGARFSDHGGAVSEGEVDEITNVEYEYRLIFATSTIEEDDNVALD